MKTTTRTYHMPHFAHIWDYAETPSAWPKYSKCPNRPEGYPWWCHCSGRYGSAGWGFDTIEEALDYAKDQYQQQVVRAMAKLHPGDEHSVTDFRANISGPGGKLPEAVVWTMVTDKPWPWSWAR